MFSILDAYGQRPTDTFVKDKRKSPNNRAKIKDEVNKLINAKRYSDLITYAKLMAGQYNLDEDVVDGMLDYTERFSTALDYDVAMDYQLHQLVRVYHYDGKTPPLSNQKQARKIIRKSRKLHETYPNNCYFSKNTFHPVNHVEAGVFKQYIHKIIQKYGITNAQYDELHYEFEIFLKERLYK